MPASTPRSYVLLPLLLPAVATAIRRADSGECVAPGSCSPPQASHSVVIRGPSPGQQWNYDGGFCGAWSTQQCALAHGVYVSQDLVRKANRESSGPHDMHGNTRLGYEVMPINVAFTAEKLKLDYDEWDYTQPSPQAAGFKAWLKAHLVGGNPIVFFPMCKGDGHKCYRSSPEDEGSCPNGGTCDHVEPIFGIFTNASLDDATVYDDDVILHASDQDMMPYFRRMETLQDSEKMDGNCAIAQPGFGKNEMYPCFDEDVTYGLAVKGTAATKNARKQQQQSNSSSSSREWPVLPHVSLTIDIDYEPNVRIFEKPCVVHGNVSVDLSGLEHGQQCTLYRYNSTEAFPTTAPYDQGYQYATNFTVDLESSSGKAKEWAFSDPNPFYSNTAVYYLATCA